MKLKPYMLVEVTVKDQYVEQGERRFIGEVMSFETPEHTVMVRCIPNHPGTLIEVPVSAVRLNGGRPRYVHYAIVKSRLEGGRYSGAFPCDMLRYDSCVPANFTIEDTEYGPRAVLNADQPEGAELLVADVADHQFARWTERRWSSFGWVIKQKITERITQT